MELERLKDARSEPICKVCGQTEPQHQTVAGTALHPFEAEEPVARRDGPKEPEKPEEPPPAGDVDKAGGIN
jgi:hypothetical protein